MNINRCKRAFKRVNIRGVKIFSGKSQIIIIWRAPGPCGASPTQPYKCGQYFKPKVKTAEQDGLAFAEINTLVL